jgi:hypothetical protein
MVSTRRPLAALVTVLLVLLVLPVVAAAPAGASPGVERAQRRLNHLGCQAGRVDGRVDGHTRAAVVRFQAANRMAQTAHLTRDTRRRLFADRPDRCDVRSVPARSGTGRRIVLSQRQNYVWLVKRTGRVVAQGGVVDNPAVLSRGRYTVGSKCGRAARIRRNTDGGNLYLDNFVRFAPCGIGFHRIPTSMSGGRQIHADWLLGTNARESHGCIRVSLAMSRRIWDFTSVPTVVRVLRG